MLDKDQFIKDYVEWSTQEKFKDFSFITKLSPEKQEALINGSFINIWALIFGPFYYIYLRMYRGILFLIISLFLFSLGAQLGSILYFIFAVILSLFANRSYLLFLKNKKEIYSHFQPDAKTPYFNISNKRLVILSLLTGGMYIMYWMYRNAKAMKDYQRDAIRPFWQAFFMCFTSINVFRAIAHSVKSLGYTQSLKPRVSAVIFLLLILLASFDYNIDKFDSIQLYTLLFILIFYWSLLIFQTLLILKYQKAIHFYCANADVRPSTKPTVWEIIFVFLGCLLNGGLLFITAVFFWLLFQI